MTRLLVKPNAHGVSVVEYHCEGCGATFTVCPAPEPDQDEQWTGCMASDCASYDASRDVDRLFDDGNVLSFEQRRGLISRRGI